MPLSRKLGLLGAIVFVTLLFWGGSQPEAAGLFEPPFDKAAHLIAFGGFGFLLWLALDGRWPWLVIVLAGVVGALDEWRQGFLPGRAVSLGDFAMDIVAPSLVVIVLMVLKARSARA